ARAARCPIAGREGAGRVQGVTVSGGVESLKPRVAAAVDRLADELEALSHRIHDNPELAFKEEQAYAWLTEFLETHDVKVERAVGGLPTAFAATLEGPGRRPARP